MQQLQSDPQQFVELYVWSQLGNGQLARCVKEVEGRGAIPFLFSQLVIVFRIVMSKKQWNKTLSEKCCLELQSVSLNWGKVKTWPGRDKVTELFQNTTVVNSVYWIIYCVHIVICYPHNDMCIKQCSCWGIPHIKEAVECGREWTRINTHCTICN